MAERSHLDRFSPATLRGAVPPLNGWVCLSFDQAGKVVRIRLPMEDVEALAGALDVFLGKKSLEMRIPAIAGYGEACGVGLHLPGASGGEPELVQPPSTWVGPKNEKTAATERLHASDLDVVNETRRTTLLLQARCLELKAQMLQRPASEDELSAAYAQAAWRPARELQRDLRTAGALVARVFGESVGPYEPVGFLDGEPEPQTLDEAFVLLRRLAERSGLSPMGVLKAFVAGNLAATSLGDAFPAIAFSWVDGEGVRPC